MRKKQIKPFSGPKPAQPPAEKGEQCPQTIFRPDPKKKHPPVDKRVHLPTQARLAGGIADARVSGRPVANIPKPKSTRSRPTIPLMDAEIEEALKSLDHGTIQITGPRSSTIIELARQGARLIKEHRRGARQDRKNSKQVTQRKEAVLQVYRELSSTRQKYPTGRDTLIDIRAAVIKKLGLRDDDHAVSEDTLIKDLAQLGPILRLIRKGLIPPPGTKVEKHEESEKTLQEMAVGKRAVAKAAAANMRRQSER
jgi:hypothetical protein